MTMVDEDAPPRAVITAAAAAGLLVIGDVVARFAHAAASPAAPSGALAWKLDFAASLAGQLLPMACAVVVVVVAGVLSRRSRLLLLGGVLALLAAPAFAIAASYVALRAGDLANPNAPQGQVALPVIRGFAGAVALLVAGVLVLRWSARRPMEG